VPNAELSFQLKGPEPYSKVMGDATKVFVRLEPRRQHAAALRAHGLGHGLPLEEARLWQAEAWKQAIDNLRTSWRAPRRYSAASP